jgi:hypothetical protein
MAPGSAVRKAIAAGGHGGTRPKDYRLLSYATVEMAGEANDMQTQSGEASSGG